MAGREVHDGLLGWLDGPRMVVGAFAFFLLGLAVLGVLLWTDQRKQTERLDQIVMQRLLEEKAAKSEQVANCFQRASQGPQLRLVLLALEHEVRSPTGRQQLRDFRKLNELNTPTLHECAKLAERLNVVIPEGVR